MQNKWKVETHAHTLPVSMCAKISPEEMVQQVRTAGYDAVFVTNHYTPEYFEKNNEGYVDRLEEYFADYRAAKAEGERIGLKVFPGLEVRIADGPEDFLIYGISPEELKTLGCLSHLTLAQLSEKVRSTKHGVLLQAHPFRGYCKVQDAKLLDGVEVINNNPRHDSHNDLALEFAKENHLFMTAGTDVHEMGDAGCAGVYCLPFENEEEFAEIVRRGELECFTTKEGKK